MKQNIVFFGSGPVAAASLSRLKDSFSIEAVITKPTTVQEMKVVLTENTPVYAVNTKAELDDLIKNQQFSSNLAILIDFGIIVSKTVIESFNQGIINSHFSLLPEWRGADPISFAVLSGQPKSGVTLMIIDEGMDTGKIIASKSISIAPAETTPSLTNKLIGLSATLLTEYIPRYVTGAVQPRQQPHPDRATYSRKLSKDDGILDWTKPAVTLEREIRAFSGWPKSRTTLGDKDIIVTKAHVVPEDHDANMKPGDIQHSLLDDGILMIATGDGFLSIDSLKPAGKNEMPAKSYLAGYRQSL